MNYPVCGILVYLICYSFLLPPSTSAEQGNGSSGAILAGQAVSSRPRCTEKNPAPYCVSVPQVVSSPQPTYSEEARKAKIEGTVVLVLIVDEKGSPTNVSVINGLGMGLNQKAIEAVKGWKFTPAFSKDGKPVAAKIAVEVDFHL
jgi:TonB family protein